MQFCCLSTIVCALDTKKRVITENGNKIDESKSTFDPRSSFNFHIWLNLLDFSTFGPAICDHINCMMAIDDGFYLHCVPRIVALITLHDYVCQFLRSSSLVHA